MQDYEYLIEISEVYDGWSIGVTADGTWVNRWPTNDRRHQATQAVIDHHNQRAEANA